MSALARDVMAVPERLGMLLAFRPVFTRNKTVAAHEILLEEGSAERASFIPDLTNNVVLDTYTDIFQNGRPETVPTLLHVSAAMLHSSQILGLPPDQYILAITTPDGAPAELEQRLRMLAGRGYRLALTGYQVGRNDLETLLDVVASVRLNLRESSLAEVADAARQVYFHRAKLAVDGIDSLEHFYACADRGVTWFQGDFLVEPTPVQGKKISSNKALLVELLAELRRPNTSPAALEQVVIKDAGLSYRILKVANSAAVGLQRQVDSLSTAISLLGTNELSRWANLLLVHGEPGKPGELLRNMLVRGRMCEVLAGLSGRCEPMTAFIVGLLSRLDVLMDIEMPELMRQVPLSLEVKRALLRREGELGQTLLEVERYENGQFDQLKWIVDAPLYEVAYRHSVSWARRAQQALEAA